MKMFKYILPVLGLVGCVSPIHDKNPTIRYHNTTELVKGETESRDRLSVEQDGVAVGYQKLNDDGKEFGVKVPINNLAGSGNNADIRFHHFDGEENEVILRVGSDNNWEVVARGFDLYDRDGFGVSANYRQNRDFEARNNLGAAVSFVSIGDERDVGGYVWGRFEELGGLFTGAGTYLNDSRLTLGMPNKGSPAWRFFRVDGNSGFERNELLVSTEGANLNGIDARATLHANEMQAVDTFTGNKGPFSYWTPSISGRGRGVTGGVVHTRSPNGYDFVKGETVKYFDDVFAGLSYSGETENLGDGRIGIPLGYQFSGGDGLTRNFFRVEPFVGLGDSDSGLLVNFEWKL